MKTLIAVLALTLTAVPAHAGFVTGAVVGAALASGGSSTPKSSSSGQYLVSDKHDVITCVKTRAEMLCARNYEKPVTPAQFAGISGYKVLHKVGVLITPSFDYIVMEVSK